MRFAIKIIAASALFISAAPVFSQNQVAPEPRNVAQLSARGAVEVQQDELILTLGASADGKDAANVQAQLRQVVDAALKVARSQAEAPQMEVRTGQFSLYPRNGRNGEITGWQGRAELVLQGRDFARITATAARIQGMPIANVGFGLSRSESERAEREAQSQAIEAFKARAATLTKAFGFAGYALREVSVSSQGQMPLPRQRMMAMEAKMSSMADSALPVEAGKSTVEVTVSGSVQMR
ncbi:MAG: SIMPL domain-containing protein [Burkholderiales bacterium]|jgi:predicted secreted protein|nr:SIMPL domain-containing protein [Burkholderiales bacterium]